MIHTKIKENMAGSAHTFIIWCKEADQFQIRYVKEFQ